MTSSSFTVNNYASKEWSVTFDIVHKDGTPLTKEETIQFQSYVTPPPERQELLEVMDKCIREVFGEDVYQFNVYFMKRGLTSNSPQYWHYFHGDTVMGGYIEFFFMDKIMTIPGMSERLELLMKNVVENAPTYAVKIVHVHVGTIHSPKCHGNGYHDIDAYKFNTKINTKKE
jgi:hypothetical protein